MRPTRFPRGQTLVLFALTVMLLALMVTFTLSLGMKVKEKMEVQVVADAAAYSNAALTARVFNEIGLMNRAQLGHMASMAAVQSAISWSSFYRGQLAATANGYGTLSDIYSAALAVCAATLPTPCVLPGCDTFCPCAPGHISELNNSQNLFQLEDQTIASSTWDSDDQAAGGQMRALQGANSALYATQQVEFWRMYSKLNGQTQAGNIVNKVKTAGPWPGEWDAPGSADNIATREAGWNPLNSAVLLMDVLQGHHLWAGMGTRGFTFTTTRADTSGVLTLRLNQVGQLQPPEVLATEDGGSAYWASSLNHGDLMPSGAFAWGDDHGTNTVTDLRAVQEACLLPPGIPPIPITNGVDAHLKSTDSSDNTDEHLWNPSLQSDTQPATSVHTLGMCISCPGMWPIFVDYNDIRLVQPSDVWGQPKNYAVIQRDYNQRFPGPTGGGDVWNLNNAQSIKFTPSGSSIDNRGTQLNALDGTVNIGKQTALSTGIAYYHRNNDGLGSHWKEPPNFLNPYWRATLVPSSVDAQGRGSDVPNTLNNANVPWAADAYNALKAQGFKGLP